VEVVNTATNGKYTTVTNEKGEYSVPALPAGVYRVSVTKTGFKTETIANAALIVGVPATVNVSLQVGQTSETVEVTAGASIVQAETADVSTNLTGRQLTDLPFATRNAIELLVDAPGTATPTNPRSSTINGLPKGALNVTIDGMNTQDNYGKSSDGYFSYIFPSIDALEEVTLETSAAGVDSTSQGGAQIKFVTKSGTNQFHGGVFWQDRNTYFNANYYFNNNQGLPRDILKLNQFGGHVGGPIIKNKVFFFVNAENTRLPGSQSFTRTYLTPSASSGIYSYVDTTGAMHNINLLALGSQAGYYSAPDPILAKTFAAARQTQHFERRSQHLNHYLSARRTRQQQVLHHPLRLQHYPETPGLGRLELRRLFFGARHPEQRRAHLPRGRNDPLYHRRRRPDQQPFRRHHHPALGSQDEPHQ
jgi:hypothetical protein